MTNPALRKRAESYCLKRGRAIIRELGGGTDGTVWETDGKTALKVLIKQQTYDLEVECYRRLLDRKMFEICGYAVPRLIYYSNELLAIEMDVVEPPRILDFGKVQLDKPWDFSEQTIADWKQQQEELWGDHWKTIQRILSRLKSIGIYYSDPNPYNITPENWDPDL